MPRVKLTSNCRGGFHSTCQIYLALDRRQTSWCRCPCHFEINIDHQRRLVAVRPLWRRPSADGRGVAQQAGMPEESPPADSPPVAAVAAVGWPLELGEQLRDQVEADAEAPLPF